MSNVEASFDEYEAHLVHMLHDKVDADLAMKIICLERKLPDTESKVELDINVRNDTIEQNLKDWFGDKLGYQVSCHKNHITAVAA